MIYEIVRQTVDPEKRDEFVNAFRDALHEANFEGYRGGKILKCIEDPAQVVSILEWDSVEAHTSKRGTPAHNKFRAAFQPYQTAPSQGAHYEVEDL